MAVSTCEPVTRPSVLGHALIARACLPARRANSIVTSAKMPSTITSGVSFDDATMPLSRSAPCVMAMNPAAISATSTTTASHALRILRGSSRSRMHSFGLWGL
jgi:hypothetical protein